MKASFKQKWQSLHYKLQHPDHRWKIYILIGILIYFVLINQVIHLRPDHVFFALVIFSFVLGKQRAKRFLIDWLPFIGFWFAYDMMRGIADTVRGTINITPPYRWELAFFQFVPGLSMPAFDIQPLRFHLLWQPIKAAVDSICGFFYLLHFVTPIVLGWIFWHTTNDRPRFYKLVYTLAALNVLALTTFMLYPAAPPWYVYNYGFAQPEPSSSFWGTSAGNLIDVDRLLGVSLFTTLWDSFNSNHFAAIPSLHGAYPLVLVFFAYKKFHRGLGWLLLYPLGVWFAAVYLNQHYVIDLLLGALYIPVAYAVATQLLYPKFFARFVEPAKEKETATALRNGKAATV